jgi:site-specific DNA-cytosine methylase
MSNAIEILKPPLIIFETTPKFSHPKRIAHLRPIIRKLLELGYELRMSVLKSTHFGVCHSQERLVLLASRVGLPALPGDPNSKLSLIEDNRLRASVKSDDLKLKLRAQGFTLPFQVCGNHESKLAQIERAFPPPMAQVIGLSLRMHVQKVMQMVVSAGQEPRMVGGQKRPPEEELQSDSGKRRCPE